jgi:signal transduction histidine kinase
LSNVFKYALPGTRVYIELSGTKQQVTLAVKNISAQELNLDPAELGERFTRGDESRSGEGSGLGLSIVMSMVRLQNGVCDVRTDGDLFKVVLTFPASGLTPIATP